MFFEFCFFLFFFPPVLGSLAVFSVMFTSEELTQIKAFLENYDYDKTGFIDPDDGIDLEYARSISVYWEECFDAFMMENADTNKDGKFHIDEVMAYFAALEDF